MHPNTVGYDINKYRQLRDELRKWRTVGVLLLLALIYVVFSIFNTARLDNGSLPAIIVGVVALLALTCALFVTVRRASMVEVRHRAIAELKVKIDQARRSIRSYIEQEFERDPGHPQLSRLPFEVKAVITNAEIGEYSVTLTSGRSQVTIIVDRVSVRFESGSGNPLDTLEGVVYMIDHGDEYQESLDTIMASTVTASDTSVDLPRVPSGLTKKAHT